MTETNLSVPEVENELIGYSVEHKLGQKRHFCVHCQFPINTYGRINPCLHTFCLSCATDMPTCFVCSGAIVRIERIAYGSPYYMSPLTFQGFKNEQTFNSHLVMARRRLNEVDVIVKEIKKQHAQQAVIRPDAPNAPQKQLLPS